jgi:UDP-N-acetyl-D-galactosamine dehydrogenase
MTFKENCPDIRNTRVTDIINGLRDYGAEVTVCDPWADPEDVRLEYGLEIVSDVQDLSGTYDGIILAVAHEAFRQMGNEKLRTLRAENSVVYDIKSVLPRTEIDGRL